MAVLKEWNCLEHGEFESSHAICPADGCESRAVVREFRTAPRIGSRMVKQFEAGMKRSSDMMHINNFRTAREGEAAYGGEVAKEKGMQVLWGDAECKKVLGRTGGELMNLAHRPLVVQKRDGSGELRLERNNAMREAATEAGITRRKVAKPGELRIFKGDVKSEPVAKAITA